MKKIYCTADEIEIVKNVLGELCQYTVAFGSRIKGTHEKFSDLDLCIKAENSISLEKILSLKRNFSNSDLPYKIDLIDYHSIGDAFQTIINQDGVPLNNIQPA